MNTPNETQDTVQTSAYNPFPEPQTIPAGWDTSVIYSTPLPTAEQKEDLSES